MNLATVLFSFNGRIPRSTYWYFSLAYLGATFVALFLDLGLGTYHDETGLGLFQVLLSLLAIFPGLAVSVKRCHDRDHSGWFVLIGLIPLLGGIVLFIDLGLLRGTVGPNRFGPDPIAPAVAVAA